jgi:DNA primase
VSIDANIIEEIEEANKIEHVVMEYLPNLRHIGNNWRAVCPFHDDKNPSFIVNSEKGIFKCFGCNVSGNVFNFIMLINNVSWIEAVKILAAKCGIHLNGYSHSKYFIKKDMILQILEEASSYYHNFLLNKTTYEAILALKYLYTRGIDDKIIKEFKIGFCNSDKYFLRKKLLTHGYSLYDLQISGVIGKLYENTYFEYMTNRLVFPIVNIHGQVIAFGGRALNDEMLAKYINTPETIVYSKSKNLYGLFQSLPSISKKRTIIIVEGYIDVLALHQSQICNTVAVLGSTFTKEYAKLIARYAHNVILMFDPDHAGEQTTQRALENLIHLGIMCRVVQLPNKMDADEYIIRYGKCKFINIIKTLSMSPIDFMIRKLSNNVNQEAMLPEVKALIIDKLLYFIANINNIIIRMEWIKYIAHYFNLNEQIILSEFFNITHINQRNRKQKILYRDVKVKKMSIEEILLEFILQNRDYIHKINTDIFENKQCKKVIGFLKKGLTDKVILNSLIEKKEKTWFVSLILSSVKYSDINKTFITILQDLKKNKIKQRINFLSKKISLMTKIPKDKETLKEYMSLLNILKNSGNQNNEYNNKI